MPFFDEGIDSWLWRLLILSSEIVLTFAAGLPAECLAVQPIADYPMRVGLMGQPVAPGITRGATHMKPS